MIFYTCITNGYDKVPDVFYDPDCKYICFHDGSIDTTKEPWIYIELDEKEECPVRRSYHPKHCPHLYFDEGDYVVWVDGSYNITRELIDYAKKYKGDLCLPKHPYNRTLLAEFNKLHAHGFSTKEEIIEMARLMQSRGYTLKDYDQTINCVILRRLTPKVIEWCKTWREWYMGGVNRDQISSSVAEFLVCKADRIDFEDLVETDKKYESVSMLMNTPKNVKRKYIDLIGTGRIKPYNHSYNITKPTNKSVVELQEELNNIWNSPDISSLIIKASTDTKPYESGSGIDGQLIVFTCITNAYDIFPEESYYDPNVRYVCFHDGTIKTNREPWQYVELDLDIKDPRDFSYYVKAHPHEFFPKDSYTVWIDGCFILTKEFIDNSMKSFPFSALKHGGNFTFYDEVLEGYTCAFFDEMHLVEMCEDLKLAGYIFRNYSSPQCTILWRKLTDDIKKFDEVWYDWGTRGVNRDNIPFDAAIQFTGTKPLFYDKRDDSGIKLGFMNKKGRVGKHPQHGEMDQYLSTNNLMKVLFEITGLSVKMYVRYKHHDFYMKYFGVI